MTHLTVHKLETTKLVEAVGLAGSKHLGGFMVGKPEPYAHGTRVTVTFAFPTKKASVAFLGAVVRYLGHPVECFEVFTYTHTAAATRETRELSEHCVEV